LKVVIGMKIDYNKMPGVGGDVSIFNTKERLLKKYQEDIEYHTKKLLEAKKGYDELRLMSIERFAHDIFSDYGPIG